MKMSLDIGPIHFVGIGGIGMSGIAEAMVTRKAERSVEMAEKKVTRQKEMAATRARKAASKKAEADAAADVD